MFLNKIIFVLILTFIINQLLVESCNSNTGTTGLCKTTGEFNSECSDYCACKSTMLMTCIENKCKCNLKSQGDFGATCSKDCPCKSSLGLICTNGQCKCNLTLALWDSDKCVDVETTTSNCDKLIGSLVKASDTPFKTNPVESGWKCVTSTRILYGPSYVESTSKGKYYYGRDTTGILSFRNCNALGGKRIQPSAGDVMEKFFAKYSSVNVLIGVSRNNLDRRYYYDNNTSISLELTNKVNDCVTLVSDSTGNISYTSIVCTDLYKYICVF